MTVPRSARLGPYDRGATPFFACQADQRFSYCLYVPSGYDPDAGTDRPVLVTVHGSHRVAESYRNAYRAFSERTGCIVLAPLFPVGVGRPDDASGYKFLFLDGLRFDRVLLAMVEEVREKYGVRPADFLLAGFSGGGQFAHRFLYCHPARLRAVSIGAPGVVTLLDEGLPWWVGVGGLAEAMGCAPDLDAMRKVRVQMVIGGADTGTDEIILAPGHRYWMPGINDAGGNRVERLEALRAGYERAGIPVTFDRVPGIGHSGFELISPVERFFEKALA
ncbi:MAG TPA: alpha/beta hydrolase [Azospirillaceae bacterium]|nr:alpha/beta hydrolase [Azospirillaceae bacterium]